MSTESSERLGAIDLGRFLVVLADNGFADEVGSWVSDSVENLPITGERLLGVLDRESVAVIAEEAGLSVEEYADELARRLPGATDAVTPQGELTEDAEFERFLDEFFEGVDD